MTFEIIFVLLALAGMVAALVFDLMRPGMILFTVVVIFMCAGILSPKEMLEGFSNKGMITVAMLFLVSEGIRQSGALGQLIKKLLPQGKTTVRKAQVRMLPSIAFVSAFLNNTPVVVIFAPIIKRWAQSVDLPYTKFLIPLSFVTILGGICTLIGTSTNLVVHGMILDAGYRGLTMFELGKVGIFIALAGMVYLFFFSNRLLPDVRTSRGEEEEEAEEESTPQLHRVETILGSRFPGINKTLGAFNFKRHYGAEVKEIKRKGKIFTEDLNKITLHEGDTLVLMADDTFIPTWGESSVFVVLANGTEEEKSKMGAHKRWFALVLMVIMIIGATIGELPFMQKLVPGIKLDMFFFVSITTVIMAWTKIFPPRKYTKYISWDILIIIACAFAISKAMVNSGFADYIAAEIITMSDRYGPHVLLAIIFIITNVFTEIITNNAAAALAFPLSLSIAQQLGVDPMPFFVTVCIAASSSFSTPIGYQTNLIVQGFGNYKFTDFVKIGLSLNILAFLISIFLIPLIWPFN
ncbi:MAG: anion permease [Bacteroides sp.]|nr:anion permease [Bacteroides sp.]